LDLHQYDVAIPAFEKALAIYKKWKTKPAWVWNYTALGLAYHEAGQYKKERILYKKVELDFPANSDLIYRQAVLSFSLGDTVEAKRYIEKFKTIQGNNSVPEAGIMTDLANIYLEAGILYNAEEFYRQALSLEPDKTDRMNNLACFLIDKERNIKEGQEIVNEALKLKPDDYSLLESKGWGLYKQGKYKEALDVLQKSWDLRREKATYNHEAFLHLEAAKKAVDNQKNE
jgi:tetratricopeptide (TPR) repeat protein